MFQKLFRWKKFLFIFLPPQKQLNLINETLIYKFVWLQTKQIACPVEVKLGLKFYFTFRF